MLCLHDFMSFESKMLDKCFVECYNENVIYSHGCMVVC